MTHDQKSIIELIRDPLQGEDCYVSKEELERRSQTDLFYCIYNNLLSLQGLNQDLLEKDQPKSQKEVEQLQRSLVAVKRDLRSIAAKIGNFQPDRSQLSKDLERPPETFRDKNHSLTPGHAVKWYEVFSEKFKSTLIPGENPQFTLPETLFSYLRNRCLAADWHGKCESIQQSEALNATKERVSMACTKCSADYYSGKDSHFCGPKEHALAAFSYYSGMSIAQDSQLSIHDRKKGWEISRDAIAFWLAYDKNKPVSSDGNFFGTDTLDSFKRLRAAQPFIAAKLGLGNDTALWDDVDKSIASRSVAPSQPPTPWKGSSNQDKGPLGIEIRIADIHSGQFVGKGDQSTQLGHKTGQGSVR